MSSKFREQIIEAEQRLRQAQLHSDVEVLDELIAPDLIFTTHMGQLASKADDLASHRAGVLRLKEAVPSEEHIRFYEGFAVISVLMHMVGTYEGAPIDQRLRYTRVWSLSPNGSIQLVAGHMSEVLPG